MGVISTFWHSNNLFLVCSTTVQKNLKSLDCKIINWKQTTNAWKHYRKTIKFLIGLLWELFSKCHYLGNTIQNMTYADIMCQHIPLSQFMPLSEIYWVLTNCQGWVLQTYCRHDHLMIFFAFHDPYWTILVAGEVWTDSEVASKFWK